MFQDESTRGDFFRVETLENLNLTTSPEEGEQNSICKHCKAYKLQLSLFREYIGDPLAFIFMFYNKLSGGDIERYFSNRLREVVLDVDGIATHISFVDMISELDNGVKHVKNSLKLTSKDICIIGIGGDGSFSTLVNLFLEKIPESEERLIFAVLPFGTGNDWARNFGWSSYGNLKFMKDDFTPLVDLARGIFTSKVVNFDTWNIEVELTDNENSCFLRVNPFTQELEKIVISNENEEKFELNSVNSEKPEVSNKLLKLRKKCLNYFSFGEESRVGMTFDTYRRKNVLINRALYGLAGSVFSVNLKNKQQNIPLSHSTQGVYLVNKNERFSHDSDFYCALCPNGMKHLVDNIGIKKSTYEGNIDICPTLSNSVSLVFLNIETFGGGVHLWKNSKNFGHSIPSDDSKTNINLKEMVGTISSLLTIPTIQQVEQSEIDIEIKNEIVCNDSFVEKEMAKDIEISSSETIYGKNSYHEKIIKEKIMNIIPSSCDRKMEIMSFSGLLDISSIFLPYMNAAKRVGQFSPFDVDNIEDMPEENCKDKKRYECNNTQKNREMQLEEKNLVIIFNNTREVIPETDRSTEVYFQIDGEYYLAKEPKQCILRYDRTIRVLQCVIPYSPFVIK